MTLRAHSPPSLPPTPALVAAARTAAAVAMYINHETMENGGCSPRRGWHSILSQALVPTKVCANNKHTTYSDYPTDVPLYYFTTSMLTNLARPLNDLLIMSEE